MNPSDLQRIRNLLTEVQGSDDQNKISTTLAGLKVIAEELGVDWTYAGIEANQKYHTTKNITRTFDVKVQLVDGTSWRGEVTAEHVSEAHKLATLKFPGGTVARTEVL